MSGQQRLAVAADPGRCGAARLADPPYQLDRRRRAYLEAPRRLLRPRQRSGLCFPALPRLMVVGGTRPDVSSGSPELLLQPRSVWPRFCGHADRRRMRRWPLVLPVRWRRPTFPTMPAPLTLPPPCSL
jgi:hypothetical protein